jgi:hypothetical protein
MKGAKDRDRELGSCHSVRVLWSYSNRFLIQHKREGLFSSIRAYNSVLIYRVSVRIDSVATVTRTNPIRAIGPQMIGLCFVV